MTASERDSPVTLKMGYDPKGNGPSQLETSAEDDGSLAASENDGPLAVSIAGDNAEVARFRYVSLVAKKNHLDLGVVANDVDFFVDSAGHFASSDDASCAFQDGDSATATSKIEEWPQKSCKLPSLT